MLSTSSSNDFLCPFCFELLPKININELEFTPIKCSKCLKLFTFLFCVHCKKKIYFHSKEDKEDELNGLNGFNIKCPHLNCEKYIFISKCQKCKKRQKFPFFIPEGKPITCQFKECNNNYIYINCPIKNCPEYCNLKKDVSIGNYPDGILYVHKYNSVNEKIMFQKIICHYCHRPIVYYTTKDDIQRYYEGQKIICPYEDCKQSFNRVICPFCNIETIFHNGYYRMGTKIKCGNSDCQLEFTKIICPCCQKILKFVHKNSFVEGFLLTCGYQKCKYQCQIVNCVYCRRINYFDKNNFLFPGQAIKCHYSDCQKIFNQIVCPFCKEYNIFPNGDFFFGKKYQCMYKNCLRFFTYFICPQCKNFILKKNDCEEGLNNKCEKCKTIYFNTGCPFCKRIILIKEKIIESGLLIQCPNMECQKIFSFFPCPNCKRSVISKNKHNVFGKCLKCSFCKCLFVPIKCKECNTKIILKDRDELDLEENIKCPKCNKNFFPNYENDNPPLKDNMILFPIIEGKGIKFGKAKVDENYLLKSEYLIKNIKLYTPSVKGDKSINEGDLNDNIDNNKTKVYYQNPFLYDSFFNYNNKNIISGFCMICHNLPIESVFVPCGHRCACYNCALTFFISYKKCPKCNSDSRTIIKRIYD